jgi:hypothetical protein
MMVPSVSTLSPREEAFCLAIVEGLSESDAYRKAYRPQRAKAKTIHEKASRIMGRSKVRARIKELMQPLIEQAQMNRLEWLESLVRIIRSDVRKMFDSSGKAIPITALGPNEAAAIAAFETYENSGGVDGPEVIGRTLRVRLFDKLKALELYAKAMGYFDERRQSPQAAVTPRSIAVEFVNPHDQLSPTVEDRSVPQKPRSMAIFGGSALTY